jgi:thioredoxin 1
MPTKHVPLIASVLLLISLPANAETSRLPSYSGTVLVLTSPSCSPCRQLNPVLEDLKSQYGRSVNIVSWNIKQYPGMVEMFNLKGVPTLIFFDARGQETSRHLGYLAGPGIMERLSAQQHRRD